MGVIALMMHDLLEFQKKYIYIISVFANDQFDKFFFVFVAYWEGKNIQNQQSIGLVTKFQRSASIKSEQRNPGVSTLMTHDLLDFQKKKVYIISVCSNEQFDKWFFVIVAYWEGKKIHNQPCPVLGHFKNSKFSNW